MVMRKMHKFDFDDEFFKEFDNDLLRKQVGVRPSSVFKAGLGLWFFGLLCFFGFWGTVIYVALHFLGKFW
jgi:hypothetical protein